MEYINYSKDKDLAKIWLNRPEKGNAIDIKLIRELTTIINEINNEDDIRFVVIGGKGKNFCSGADLNWMKQAGELDYEENLKESLELADLYHQVFYSSKLFIARISGACFGGGIGLAAACDFVIATNDSYFAFSEVRLGLVPATIAPYIINRTGPNKAKMFMLTGEKLSAAEMAEIGLVDLVSKQNSIDKELNDFVGKLRLGGRKAQQSIKRFVADLDNITDWRDVKNYTAEILARARSSTEGKEGITAYLEKRKPLWRKDV